MGSREIAASPAAVWTSPPGFGPGGTFTVRLAGARLLLADDVEGTVSITGRLCTVDVANDLARGAVGGGHQAGAAGSQPTVMINNVSGQEI
ncbi:hypothetical protein [Streptomyces sp. NBC_01565]|uniref:hypothetical protein n=1 Tax=unclassified Streptomyces TaxID=2593676 RepID=UPI0022506ED7|nr:hypothetical protein [Streptomyces sp. NBC_01565]MCX4546919.1 hypothetical protein [Streptomyces sp. NBC_01565]